MPSIDDQMLRRTVTFEQVLDLLEFIPSEREDDQVRGPSPFPIDIIQSRSFCANLTRSACQCLSCGAKGDQVDLWSQSDSLPLDEAAVDLCVCLQIGIPKR